MLLPLHGCPILLVTRMNTDQTGLLSVLLPLLVALQNKIFQDSRINSQTSMNAEECFRLVHLTGKGKPLGWRYLTL